MAVVSSQNAFSIGLGGVYTKSLAYANAVMPSRPTYSSRTFQGYTNMVMMPIPAYSSRFILFNPSFLPSASQVYSKILPTATGVDTGASFLPKLILNGGTISSISFDTKYISSGPISAQIRPPYGILWPKGHK